MNWTLLPPLEEKKFWDFIYLTCSFKPNNENKYLIKLPKPNICFDISQFYNAGFKEVLYSDLESVAIEWFKNITKAERIIALDWQHNCYSFDPNLPFEKDEFDEWLIPIFPNGDYLFFLTNDFENGIFGDGLNLQISFWGENMINALEINKARILTESKNCF